MSFAPCVCCAKTRINQQRMENFWAYSAYWMLLELIYTYKCIMCDNHISSYA